MEKGTSQFFRSAGRCGAMRHGVHAGMPTACLLGGNNLIFQKTLIFRKSLPKYVGKQQPRPKACIEGQGSPPRACSQPRPGHAAAKAKAAPMGRQPRPRHACVHAAKAKAMAAPMGWQSRPRHAAKAMACLRGHAGMPLGARSQGPSMHARCLKKGSGSTARAWHAPWVGCQGRGMPLGPLQGHGSTWGGCCCQA